MPNNKKKKYQKCTICGNQVTTLRRVDVVNKLGDSEVLERIKEFNRGNIDESKTSPFVVCDACRDAVDIAYECLKKCRALMAVQSSIDQKQSKDAITQTDSPQQNIIIINQMSKKVEQKPLDRILSNYGKIVSFYLRTDSCYYDNFDNFARITFSSEDEALKVMNASKNKHLWYHGKRLVVTRVSEDFSPIDSLPDACLTEIFLRIDDVEDKVAIGKVCKRWKEVLARSWSNMKELSDTSELEEVQSVGGLRTILKGCGRFLKSLKFTIYDHPIARIKLISEYCENIENLHLEMNCKEKTGVYHHELLSMFQQLINLRRLHMSYLDKEVNYTDLEHLPDEMLEIHLFAEVMDTSASIDLSKFQNLEALALYTYDFGENALNGIENLVNLKFLSFDASHVHPSNIRKIRNLSKLKHLAVANCGVDDEILTPIAQKNLHLEYLNISDNRSITDRSFQYVVRLPKLKTLWMKNLSEVTGADLTEMRALQWLDVEGCSSITDWALIMMIDKCVNITSVYAAGPATWRLLLNAEESIVELGRAPRKLHLHTDPHLAVRWEETGRNRKPLYVFDHSRYSKVDPESWDGWYGNVKMLI